MLHLNFKENLAHPAHPPNVAPPPQVICSTPFIGGRLRSSNRALPLAATFRSAVATAAEVLQVASDDSQVADPDRRTVNRRKRRQQNELREPVPAAA